MRIGILSHPIRDNYGGILQSWALQSVLKGREYQVELFGLQAKYPLVLYPLIWFRRILRRLTGENNGSIIYELRRWKNYHDSPIAKFINKEFSIFKLRALSKIPKGRYDAIIVGSDQVWRRQYIQSIWRSEDVTDAFLSRFQDDVCRRIAYSASFGVDKWEYSEKETECIKKALERFEAVSVREFSGVELLKDNVSCDAEWMIDPTMLLDSNEYEKISDKVKYGKNRVVSYILDTSKEKNILIDSIRKSRGLGHIELNDVDDKGHKSSIQKWLSAISSAEVVVTDSFHGCVFSIIFNKPLIFMYNTGRGNTRFDTLIKAFGIDGNAVTDTQPYNPSNKYELPSDINLKLKTYRERGMQFLKKALGR